MPKTVAAKGGRACTAIILIFLAAGCTSTQPLVRHSQESREVPFHCTNGQSLSVRFLPAQELAILLRNGESIALPQQRSGSGFIYSNGPTTIRGKGNDLTVEIGRMVPLQCKAS